MCKIWPFFAYVLYSMPILLAYEQVAPGVRYLHLRPDAPVRQSIHLLAVDPGRVSLQVGLAHDMCASSETTSGMAKRMGAIAAVNGGFFDFGCKTRIGHMMT